jgi:hypothetical protein
MTFDPQALQGLPGATPQKPSEEEFKRSMAGLSRSLEERAALHPDPVAEAAARRATLQARFRAEARRRRWMIGGAALAAAGVAAAIVFVAAPPAPPVSSTPAEVAQVQAPAPVVTAAVSPPAPEPPPSPQAAPSSDAVAAAPVGVPEPAAPPPALARDDIKEIQTRLLSFGFNPGPLDGDVGRMTVGAVMNYQQQRGRAQTGQLDRELLDQLRQDPAPKVAAARPQSQQSRTRRAPQRMTGSSPPQQPRSDGLDFVRDADAKISRWFQSLSR